MLSNVFDIRKINKKNRKKCLQIFRSITVRGEKSYPLILCKTLTLMKYLKCKPNVIFQKTVIVTDNFAANSVFIRVNVLLTELSTGYLKDVSIVFLVK